MPMRDRASFALLARQAAGCRAPSISMMPSSGSIRPRMHFSSTDLPEPEPPITTMEVRGMHVEVDAVEHELRRRRIFGRLRRRNPGRMLVRVMSMLSVPARSLHRHTGIACTHATADDRNRSSAQVVAAGQLNDIRRPGAVASQVTAGAFCAMIGVLRRA